jgi:hypothetical protein
MKNLNLEKVGLVGSVFATLCCLGFGPLLAFLSAIGAGFLANDKILLPLFVASVVLGAVGLFLSFRHHHRWPPLALHIVSGSIVLIFAFVAHHRPLVWVGIVGLITAAVWDFALGRHWAAKTEAAPH